MTVANISRRNFIKTVSVSAGGFMLGLNLPIPNEALAQTSDHLSANFNPNAFIHITNSGDTFIYCGRSEMGQGISTALTSAVADELEADWQRVTVKQADGDEKYGPQATGGSASIRTMFNPMREAGAAAKEMLIIAAAKVWHVATSDCFAQNHYVINKINQQQ
jgi:isoquinoline 1-oxidoreductase beta subunit